jgi:hypothetical protein
MNKELPMLFCGDMVRAILSDIKTQTRRLVKPRLAAVPESKIGGVTVAASLILLEKDQTQRGDNPPPYGWNIAGKLARLHAPHPVGSRIWVKETWRTSLCCNDRKPTEMEKPGMGFGWPVWYEADGFCRGKLSGGLGFINKGKLRPSIFMPRWASRITLEVTDVRVERLNEISESDAQSEGCAYPAGGPNSCYRMAYQTLWDSINGKTFPWESNPWVWVYTFRRVV